MDCVRESERSPTVRSKSRTLFLVTAIVVAQLTGTVWAVPAHAATLRDEIVGIAVRELNDGSRNFEYGGDTNCTYYNGYWSSGNTGCGPAGWRGPVAWCANFARYVWKEAGVPSMTGLNAWAYSFAKYGHAKGTLQLPGSGYAPRPGDALVFDYDDARINLGNIANLTDGQLQDIDHVGLVKSYSNGTITYIHGNTSSNNIKQSTSSLSNSDIRGFISPVGADGVVIPIDVTARRLVDVDGDSRADVVGRYNNHLYLKLSTSTTSAVSFSTTWIDVDGVGWNNWDLTQFGDVTGDGLPELVGRYNGHLWFKRNTSSVGSVSFADWHDDGAGWHTWTAVQLADIDGDGRDDVVGRYSDRLYAKLSTSTATSISFSPTWIDISGIGWNSWDLIQFGDVTGDGLPELVGRYNNHLWFKRNTSSVGSVSFADWYDDGTGWNAWTALLLADVNGDGKEDVTGRYDDRFFVKFSTSTATAVSFSDEWSTIGLYGWDTWDSLQFGDVNADGLPDLAGRNNGHLWFKRNASSVDTVSTSAWYDDGAGWHTWTLYGSM